MKLLKEIIVDLFARQVPPPMSPEDRKRLDARQRNLTDAQKMSAQWEEARQIADGRPPDFYENPKQRDRNVNTK